MVERGPRPVTDTSPHESPVMPVTNPFEKGLESLKSYLSENSRNDDNPIGKEIVGALTNTVELFEAGTTKAIIHMPISEKRMQTVAELAAGTQMRLAIIVGDRARAGVYSDLLSERLEDPGAVGKTYEPRRGIGNRVNIVTNEVFKFIRGNKSQKNIEAYTALKDDTDILIVDMVGLKPSSSLISSLAHIPRITFSDNPERDLRTKKAEGEVTNTPEEQQCVHHWILDPPEGKISLGRCRHCNETKDFKNDVPITTSTQHFNPQYDHGEDHLVENVRRRVEQDRHSLGDSDDFS